MSELRPNKINEGLSYHENSILERRIAVRPDVGAKITKLIVIENEYWKWGFRAECHPNQIYNILAIMEPFQSCAFATKVL